MLSAAEQKRAEAAAHEHDKWLTQRRQGNAELSRPPRMTSSFCDGLKVSDILKLVVGIHLRRTRSHTHNHSARKCTQADDSTHGLFRSHIISQRPAAAEQMWRVGSVLGGWGVICGSCHRVQRRDTHLKKVTKNCTKSMMLLCWEKAIWKKKRARKKEHKIFRFTE